MSELNATASSSSASSLHSQTSSENESGSSSVSSAPLLLPAIINGEYYTFVGEKSVGDMCVARSISCSPKVKEIKGHRSTTSNFLRHLRRAHPTQYDNMRNKNIIRNKTNGKEDMKEDLQIQLAKTIIDSLVPLSFVDNPQFKKFLDMSGVTNNMGTVSRRTMGRLVKNLFMTTIHNVKNEMQQAEYVCTTADIWSGRRRSFMGVTAHWISDTYERRSAALACRKFNSPHTFDKIAELLLKIHDEFFANKTVIATVTDNASNFKKAFRVHGMNPGQEEDKDEEEEEEGEKEKDTVDGERGSVEEEEDTEEEEEDEDDDDDDDDDDNDDDKEEKDDDEDQEEVASAARENRLPRHIKCAAHTLNLCATKDIARIMEQQPELKKIHLKVLSKCNELWKAGVRPKSAEKIGEIAKCAFKRPVPTRWNSLYDALQQLMNLKNLIGGISKSIGIDSATTLRSKDFAYIQEYIKCTKPIAEAIDALQGEKYIFYGMLLPTLLSARYEIVNLITEEWIYCSEIPKGLLNSVETRFGNILYLRQPEGEDAAIAALCHPHFKWDWFPCVSKMFQETAMKKLTEVVAEKIKKNAEGDIEAATGGGTQKQKDTYYKYKFNFGYQANIQQRHLQDFLAKAQIQVHEFLKSKNQKFDLLDLYPEIKEVFYQHNTPLPSSGPVERLFSYATIMDAAKSNRLSDRKFERRVVTKANMECS